MKNFTKSINQENRNEVVDIKIEEFSGATSNQINEWEVVSL